MALPPIPADEPGFSISDSLRRWLQQAALAIGSGGTSTPTTGALSGTSLTVTGRMAGATLLATGAATVGSLQSNATVIAGAGDVTDPSYVGAILGPAVGQSSGTDQLVGPGVDLAGTYPGPHVQMVVGVDSFKSLAFLWKDLALGWIRPIGLRDDTILGGFAWMPGKDSNVLKPVYLGSNTDSSNRGRFAGAYLTACDVVNGYIERGRTVPIGEWTTFTPTLTASAGTWTGATIARAAYMLSGKTMSVEFEIDSSNVSAAPLELFIVIPGGFTAAAVTRNLFQAIDAALAAPTVGVARVTAGGTVIRLQSTVGGAGWATTAGNNTFARGQLSFEVQ